MPSNPAPTPASSAPSQRRWLNSQKVSFVSRRPRWPAKVSARRKARDQQRGTQPDGGIEPEQHAKHCHAEEPQQNARLKRSPLALRIEIDRNDPNKRRREPGHDPELGVADHAAVIQLVGGQRRSNGDGERKARGGGADVGKPALPPGFDRALVHRRLLSLSAPARHAPKPGQRIDPGDLVQRIALGFLQ